MAMSTITVGKLICDRCGEDCTPPKHLHGFIMRKMPFLTREQAEEFSKIEKEFGKSEFSFCWKCTARMFGAKTLAEKEAIEAGKEVAGQVKPDLPKPPAENHNCTIQPKPEPPRRGRPPKPKEINNGSNDR